MHATFRAPSQLVDLVGDIKNNWFSAKMVLSIMAAVSPQVGFAVKGKQLRVGNEGLECLA